MICNDVRMHRARVFPLLMLLMLIVIVVRASEVDRPYLYRASNRERYCDNENINSSLHLVVRLL